MKQYKNKKHLEWIHEFPCALTENKDCLGSIQAHHLLKPWDGFRGMGMKASDKNLIPLCLRHHIMLHKRGNELKFFEEMSGDEDYGKKIAEYYWNNSPYKEDEK
jgi:hypothetical protein